MIVGIRRELMYKNALRIAVLLICLSLGFFFAKVYQPQGKTVRIYQNALTDYENGNYSNAYYLFSKIGYISPLKPVAIYRQAMCSKVLGDKKAELKNYQKLFKFFPSNKLSLEAKYNAGQLLVEDNPDLALKYFSSVAKNSTDEDYRVASEYYKAKIAVSKIKYSKRRISKKKTKEIENSFRTYLKTAPDGRLAVSSANTWKKFNSNLDPNDALLIARAYYLADMYNDASEMLKKTDKKTSWALWVSNSYALGDLENAKNTMLDGLPNSSNDVDKNDYRRAVNDYLKIFDDDRYTYTSKLFSLAGGKNKDYVWKLKCESSKMEEKAACYRALYANFPSGDYAESSLLQIFYSTLRQKNYAEARGLAHDFLARFSDSAAAPEVMFWAGKIEQRYSHTTEAVNYFRQIINKYPDTYYAYRSFWILKGIQTSVINAPLEYRPVVYPYKHPGTNGILHSLLLVNDYDMLVKFSNDEFIKSWVEYQRGNYASSMLIARDAMAKLEEKPGKNDLRWRLVYPQNYYKQVKNFANQYRNNDALMMSIIREESYFNSEAQSGVGAIGLMQLMPSTAHDIGEKNGITFNTSYLFNPELNIKLGNLYYSTIRQMLDNKDVSAIAAYNGGIGSVTRWKSSLNYNDTDEFVDQIPYDETKNYVIKVFRSYWNYIRIYQQ